jgi:transcriptional regulator with XRE-family HTH domain
LTVNLSELYNLKRWSHFLGLFSEVYDRDSTLTRANTLVYQKMDINLLVKRGVLALPLSRGMRLQRLRDEKGVKLRHAAKEIDVSPAYLSLLEHDQKGKDPEHIRGTMERAARYYGVLPAYLLASTPQEYMAECVVQVGLNNSDLTTVGKRLRWVLAELNLRWGEEFSESQVAETLGVKIDTLRGYLDDRVPMNDKVVDQITELTGVPIDFFFPRPKMISEDDPAIRRVITLAVQSGIAVDELEYVIQAWMVARSNKKPSV